MLFQKFTEQRYRAKSKSHIAQKKLFRCYFSCYNIEFAVSLKDNANQIKLSAAGLFKYV